MFEVGNCSGLYYSTGESYSAVPGQQDQHLTWKPVVQQPDFNHTIQLTIHNPSLPKPVPILTFGKSTLVIERAGAGYARLRIENPGGTQITWPTTTSWKFAIKRNYVPWIDVMTDPNLHSIEVRWAGEFMLGHYLGGDGPAVVQVTHAKPGALGAIGGRRRCLCRGTSDLPGRSERAPNRPRTLSLVDTLVAGLQPAGALRVISCANVG